jgi:membrane associated rhomboid family serine protease
MVPARKWQQNFTFGGRIPWAVGLLIALTAALSLLTAFGDRHAAPLSEWVALQPVDVWHGQVWRLLTWSFVEGSPIGLIFGCLALYWFGPALAQRWGSPRFLTVIMGTMLVAGGGTCLLALVDPPVMGMTYVGSWAMTTALVVMWGLSFPDNVVRVYLVLPIRGFWMAWLTVAITVVYAVYTGWLHLLPELFAEAAALAWMYQALLLARWSRARGSYQARRRAAERASQARRRGGVVVDLRTGEPPPPKRPEDAN